MKIIKRAYITPDIACKKGCIYIFCSPEAFNECLRLLKPWEDSMAKAKTKKTTKPAKKS